MQQAMINFLGFAANEELWWDFWGASASKVFLFIYCLEAAKLIHTVDGSEVPNDHRFWTYKTL